MRNYNHSYPPSTIIKQPIVHIGVENKKIEEDVWGGVWSKIKYYAEKNFTSEGEKKIFWAKTKEGLEVCKWMGQAFKENVYDDKSNNLTHAKLHKKGDILNYYNIEKNRNLPDLDKFNTFLVGIEGYILLEVTQRMGKL